MLNFENLNKETKELTILFTAIQLNSSTCGCKSNCENVRTDNLKSDLKSGDIQFQKKVQNGGKRGFKRAGYSQWKLWSDPCGAQQAEGLLPHWLEVNRSLLRLKLRLCLVRSARGFLLLWFQINGEQSAGCSRVNSTLMSLHGVCEGGGPLVLAR